MSANEAKRLKRVYWLCDAVSDRHRTLTVRLQDQGHAVQFFSNMELLVAELKRQRAPIIIIGDEVSPGTVEKYIAQLASMPEVQGVRMVLSVSHQHPQLSLTAACASFRDLIPLDLPDQRWLERFLFATARSPIALTEPTPQLAINQLASVSVPARLVWISDRRLLFEAKLRPATGSTFVMTGKFAEALGLSRITLAVEESRRTDLIYRFSDAIIARWNVPETLREPAKQLLNKMRQTDFGPRVKVFVGIQDAELRNHFAKELDPLRFELNIALQKQSLVDEPKYFCPQIVFLEDRLCLGADLDRIRKMFDVLAPDVPVFIIGNRVQLKTVQNLDPLRKITQLQRVPAKLTDAIFTRFLPTNSRKNLHADDGAVNINPDHPFSMIELHLSARMTKIHPTVVQLALPTSVGQYGLIKVDAPDIKKAIGFAPYAKITLQHDNYRVSSSSYPYVAEAYLSDVGAEDQRKLGVSLAQTAAQSFAASTSLVQELRSQVQPLSRVVGQNSVSLPPPPMSMQTSKFESYSVDDIPKAPQQDELKPVTIEMEAVSAAVRRIGKKTKKLARSEDLRNFIIFAIVTVAVMTGIYYFTMAIAPSYHKSGGAYTDSLKKFAPKKFEHPQDGTEE